jgi:misacylated tRNA(Ala) deacylase
VGTIRALYMDNMDLREWDTLIKAISEDSVELEATAFYPHSGGVACDYGIIESKGNGRQYNITFVKKDNNTIIHIIGEHSLKPGDRVHAMLDWQRRYKLMRMHTAAHLLSSLFHDIGAKITGNSIDTEKSRMDFSIDEFDRDLIERKVEEANKLISNGAGVTISYMKREDALKIPSMIKLAGALPPDAEELRIVTIEGIDEQADGGCHVSNISEIGIIVLGKLENKGSKNRRLTYILDD